MPNRTNSDVVDMVPERPQNPPAQTKMRATTGFDQHLRAIFRESLEGAARRALQHLQRLRGPVAIDRHTQRKAGTSVFRGWCRSPPSSSIVNRSLAFAIWLSLSPQSGSPMPAQAIGLGNGCSRLQTCPTAVVQSSGEIVKINCPGSAMTK